MNKMLQCLSSPASGAQAEALLMKKAEGAAKKPEDELAPRKVEKAPNQGEASEVSRLKEELAQVKVSLESSEAETAKQAEAEARKQAEAETAKSSELRQELAQMNALMKASKDQKI